MKKKTDDREYQKFNIVCSDPGWLLGTQMEIPSKKWDESRNLLFLSTHAVVCMSVFLQKPSGNLVSKATVVGSSVTVGMQLENSNLMIS